MRICALLVFDARPPMDSAQNFNLNNQHPAQKKGGSSEYVFLPKVIPDKRSRQLKSNWDVVDKLVHATREMKMNTTSSPQTSELTTSHNILPKQPLGGVAGENPRSLDAQSMRLLSLKHDMNKNSSNYVFNANNLVYSFIHHAQTGQLQPSRRVMKPAKLNCFDLSANPKLNMSSTKLSLENPFQCPIAFAPVSCQRQEWAQRSGVDVSGAATERLQTVARPRKVNYQQIMREQRESRAKLKRKAQIKLKWKGAYEQIVAERRTRRARVYAMFEKCSQDLLKKHFSRKDGKVSEQVS